MEIWQWVLQGGSTAALLLFLYGFKAGWWATRWEVNAWKERTARSEALTDTLTPEVKKMAASVERMATSRERDQAVP